MALPKLIHPTFKVKLPSNNKVVTLRPYTTKEEKILLVAKMSDDPEDIVDAIKDVLRNCIVSPSNLDVDKLSTFDFELLYLRLYAASVKNVIELNLEEDGTEYKALVDLNKVDVTIGEINNKIDLGNNVGIVMKFPTFAEMDNIRATFTKLEEETNNEEAINKIMLLFVTPIDKLYDEEKVYVAGKDFTTEEALEFLDNLPSAAVEKIRDFFVAIPTVTADVEFVSGDGKRKSMQLKGLADFFQ